MGHQDEFNQQTSPTRPVPRHKGIKKEKEKKRKKKKKERKGKYKNECRECLIVDCI